MAEKKPADVRDMQSAVESMEMINSVFGKPSRMMAFSEHFRKHGVAPAGVDPLRGSAFDGEDTGW